MITRPTLYEQIKDTMAQHSFGVELTTGQIKDEVHVRHSTNKSSVIPTDYCYNRDNQGIDFEKCPKLFIYIGRGRLQYIGENHAYEGDVMAMPRGKYFDVPVGKWEKGSFIRYPNK